MVNRWFRKNHYGARPKTIVSRRHDFLRNKPTDFSSPTHPSNNCIYIVTINSRTGQLYGRKANDKEANIITVVLFLENRSWHSNVLGKLRSASIRFHLYLLLLLLLLLLLVKPAFFGSIEPTTVQRLTI